MSAGTGTAPEGVVPRGDDVGQLELWTEMAALERERIASRDRVTAVMEAGFERMDAAHERLFQFQRETLTRDDAYRNRVLSQVVRFGWAGVVLVSVVLAVLLFMTLWGSAEQRQAAFTWMGVGGALLTGVLIGRAWKGGKQS